MAAWLRNDLKSATATWTIAFWHHPPYTKGSHNSDTEPELIREVLRDEERRFADLMTRGRKVLARFGPGWQPAPDDLTYLHQTHGLPPDLVAELLAGRDEDETKSRVLGQ